MPIQRVLEAIEAIKRGEMVVMLDDEDRENEGDLVYASMFSSPDHVNFMATHAKGLICVALSQDIADRLELQPMVQKNNSSYETAFTISVDAAEATTGISAGERDMTIKLLADPLSRPESLVRPGHIFPLIAKDGGTLVRIGHTEGSVDLCNLAGLSSSAVICEIMKEDGTMARRDDLDIFCEKHNLKTVFISDIVEYRLAKEILVESIEEIQMDFFGVEVTKQTFKDHTGSEHTAIKFYGIHEEANVKVHNIQNDMDLLLDQPRYNHMIKSIEYLKQNGGVLLFINRPQQTDISHMKEYGIGAQILKALGIKKIRLLTSSAAKSFSGLGGFGLEVSEAIHVDEA
jgi:3,4-dihydroxy 2-butanone 4-phosphate synthase/GTP cyclohydrolase II